MAKWIFEPGHTAAEFKAKHMLVTWVRGSFKNINGTMNFDLKNPENSSVEIVIDAKTIWSGDEARDKHLRSEDFLNVEKYPEISFKGNEVEVLGEDKYKVTGDLTIRGVTKKATLNVQYLGEVETPFWEDGVNKGERTRVGFLVETKINRYDFGVSWNEKLSSGGLIVGEDVFITIDAEALLEKE